MSIAKNKLLYDYVGMQTILSDQTNKKDYSMDLHKVIEYVVSILVLVLPVFFIPVTAEAVGFNKVYLVMFAAVLVLLLFFINGFKGKGFKIQDPRAYVGLAAILIAGVLGVAFSINKNLSLFGYYGNYSSSFVYLVALLILGFVSSNLKFSVPRLLNFFAIGVTISTVFSFIPFFGFSIPFLIGNAVREFTLSGSPAAFLGLQVVAIVVSLYMVSSDLYKSKWWRIVYAIIIALNLSYLVGTMQIVPLVLVTVFFLYFLLTRRFPVKKNLDVVLPVLGIVIFFSIFALVPQTKELLGISDYNSPTRLSVQESWWISANTIRDFPIAGTGMGTYSSNFSRYRPASLNYDTAWQARFSNPYNDVFMWLSVSGLIGMLLYLFFWYRGLKDTVSLDGENSANYVLKLTMVASFAVIMLLGSNYILMVLVMVAYGTVIFRKNKSTGGLEFRNKYLSGLMVALSLILVVAFGYLAYSKYAGQYIFRESVRNTNLVDRYNQQKKALGFDPYESLYRRENVLTGLLIARQLAQQQDLSEQDKTVVQQVIQEAVLDSRRLTEIINPLDVSNWEVRGLTYNSLVGLNQNAYPFALGAYTSAINLESTNPSLWLTRGQVYYSQGNYLSAAQDFARAVQLKNDYANAHYNLAYALRDLKDYVNAATQMEIVLRLIPQDSTDREKLSQELDEFKKMAEEQQKQILQQQQAQQQLQLEEANKLEGVQENTSNETLTAPENQRGIQIEPNEEINVNEEVLETPVDVENTPAEEIPAEEPVPVEEETEE